MCINALSGVTKDHCFVIKILIMHDIDQYHAIATFATIHYANVELFVVHTLLNWDKTN